MALRYSNNCIIALSSVLVDRHRPKIEAAWSSCGIHKAKTRLRKWMIFLRMSETAISDSNGEFWLFGYG